MVDWLNSVRLQRETLLLQVATKYKVTAAFTDSRRAKNQHWGYYYYRCNCSWFYRFYISNSSSTPMYKYDDDDCR